MNVNNETFSINKHVMRQLVLNHSDNYHNAIKLFHDKDIYNSSIQKLNVRQAKFVEEVFKAFKEKLSTKRVEKNTLKNIADKIEILSSDILDIAKESKH